MTTAINPKKPFRFSLMTFLAMTTLLGVILGLVGMKMRHARVESARRNNLMQIALAFHIYHDKYKHLPPAFLSDDNGKPMHSWRVLILEMMPDNHSQQVFQQYDFSKPWNSPSNLAAGARIPSVYLNPLKNSNSQNTSYMVITGPGTLFEGATPRRFQEISDGSSNTILVVEVENSKTHWMEPKDLDAEVMPFTVNATGQVASISGFRPEGAMVGIANGSVHLLNADITSETLRRLISIDDGLPVENN